MKNFSEIYVHIPFCKKKCNYCAFNSKISTKIEIENYVDALIQEIKNRKTSDKIDSIYFGGGTPSILEISQLQKILSALKDIFFVENSAEITVEVNPGTVDKIFLQNLKKIGFNRLSIGVQTFDDKILKILGRIHNKKIALQTVENAKNFFENISVDLMYGLPTQTLENLQEDLKIISTLDLQHISIYGLEIEEGTKFFELNEKNLLELPDEEILSEMYDFIFEKIPALGFERYEISNFAKKNFESRHNTGYWTGKKYFGFGAGAHSFDKKIRESNICDVKSYIEKIFCGEKVSEVEEILTESLAMEEFCFLGLRMSEGISAKNFEKKFGKNIFEIYGEILEKYFALGLMKKNGEKIFLTAEGMKVGNVIFADFLL